jgi:cyclophilin family peptidyl-prolyl cis-trans isomerase
MSHRRPRSRDRFGLIEQLETRSLMAVDVVTPLADISVPVGSPAATITLADAFDLTDVTGTVVRFRNNVGADIYAELFDAAGPGRTRTTPATAANFLAYVDAGRYTNTAIHRSVPGFVVQGGGFAVTESGVNILGAIPQFAAVVNEPGNTNARGTIAMAKLGGDPNSATNQFFFNVANNAGNLDNQNGGFTAFARVLGNGMTVVDAIAAVPRYNLGSPFDELPATGVTNMADIARDNLVVIRSVARVGELVFTATSSNPSMATPTINPDGTLGLAYSQSANGTATITVRAASVFDASDFKEEQFTVTVGNAPAPTPPVIVTGSDIGGASQPLVTVINPTTGAIVSRFLAYEQTFRGGVRVAVGDVVGDGTEQIITAAGPGRAGEVRVFRQDGTELVAYRTFPFSAAFRGGIEVAVGDINGDDVADIVTAASRGPGFVNVFFVNAGAADPVPNTPSRSFQAFSSRYLGGATVATADVGTFAGGVATNASAADGRMEVVVGSGVGMPPRVRLYDLSTGVNAIRTITPFAPTFRGGVAVSAGRFNTDPIDDIIVTGGYRSASRVEIHSGRAVPGSTGLLATRQTFAAFGTANLPVFAAAIPPLGSGQFASLAVVQASPNGLGIRRLSASGATETLLVNVAGPLRVAASRG